MAAAAGGGGVGPSASGPDITLLQDLLELHDCGESVAWPDGLNAEGAKKIILSYEFKKKQSAKAQKEDKQTDGPAKVEEEEEDCEEVYIEAFRCPITQQRMRDPTMTPSGHSYDGPAIRQVARERGASPQTNRKLRTFDLVPNRALADAIVQVRRLQKEQKVRTEVQDLVAPTSSSVSSAPSNIASTPVGDLMTMESQRQAAATTTTTTTTTTVSSPAFPSTPDAKAGSGTQLSMSQASPSPEVASQSSAPSQSQGSRSVPASPFSQSQSAFATPAPRRATARAPKKQAQSSKQGIQRGILEMLACSPSPSQALGRGSNLLGATASSSTSTSSSSSAAAPLGSSVREASGIHQAPFATTDSLTTPARRKRQLSSELLSDLSSSRKRAPPTAGRGRK